MEVTLKVAGFRCNKCSHEWMPRSSERPLICPRCKSPRWDMPPKKKRGSK